MHIPENYLSPSTCIAATVVMLPFWKRAIHKIRTEFEPKKMPLIGIGAAFSFLTMMFNLPFPGGGTGHAVGAAILAILIGPHITLVIESIVLLIQALFFGDGGILAFGANCLNIGLIMPFSAYYIFYGVKSLIKGKKGELVGAFLSGYMSINLAALTTAILFGIQPMLFKDASGMALYAPFGLSISIPALMVPHLSLIGFVEGMITLGIYQYVRLALPGLLKNNEETVIFNKLYGILMVLVLLTPLGLLATGTAWGEWSMSELGETLGYTPEGMTNSGFGAIIPDYAIQGLNTVVAYVLSALAGMVIFILIGQIIKKVSSE